MSLQTFKKKGLLTCHGVNQSGKPAPGFWLSRGPSGSMGSMGSMGSIGSMGSMGSMDDIGNYGLNGFSINGGRRSAGYIGKESKMSKNGTPYYGEYAIGSGGTNGKYKIAQPVFNMPNVRADTQGKQYQFIKPSVLSTRGMLETRFRWIHSGVYPNYVVKNNQANDNLANNASSGVHTDTLAAANICVSNINDSEKYIDYIKKGGATGCSTTTAKRNSYNIMSSAGLYQKDLYIPQTASQQTLRIQKVVPIQQANKKHGLFHCQILLAELVRQVLPKIQTDRPHPYLLHFM